MRTRLFLANVMLLAAAACGETTSNDSPPTGQGKLDRCALLTGAEVGFVEGASYDHTWGELWFDCAGDRFCVVNARTASGDNRAQIAMQLARLVESRLR